MEGNERYGEMYCVNKCNVQIGLWYMRRAKIAVLVISTL